MTAPRDNDFTHHHHQTRSFLHNKLVFRTILYIIYYNMLRLTSSRNYNKLINTIIIFILPILIYE